MMDALRRDDAKGRISKGLGSRRSKVGLGWCLYWRASVSQQTRPNRVIETWTNSHDRRDIELMSGSIDAESPARVVKYDAGWIQVVTM